MATLRIEADGSARGSAAGFRRVSSSGSTRTRTTCWTRRSCAAAGGRWHKSPAATCSETSIDVAAELKKLEEKQGRGRQPLRRAAANAAGEPRRSRAGPPDSSRSSMRTATAKSKSAKFPSRFSGRFERLMRTADRDRDGRLSEREFLDRHAANRRERCGRQSAGRDAGRSDAGRNRDATKSMQPKRDCRSATRVASDAAKSSVHSPSCPRSPCSCRANRELCRRVLRNRNNPTGRRVFGTSKCGPRTPRGVRATERRPKMYALPPAANPLVPSIDYAGCCRSASA